MHHAHFNFHSIHKHFLTVSNFSLSYMAFKSKGKNTKIGKKHKISFNGNNSIKSHVEISVTYSNFCRIKGRFDTLKISTPCQIFFLFMCLALTDFKIEANIWILSICFIFSNEWWPSRLFGRFVWNNFLNLIFIGWY